MALEKIKNALKGEEISLGAKNPKREITLNEKQTIAMFLGLILVFGMIAVGITTLVQKSGLVDSDMSFTCTDGTIETIEKGVTTYCGMNYKELKPTISEKSFKNIENKILGRN